MRRALALATLMSCVALASALAAPAAGDESFLKMEDAAGAIAGQLAASLAGTTSAATRVAVLSLTFGEKSDAAPFGRVFADLLATQLSRAARGRFEVIERDHIARILDDGAIFGPESSINDTLTRQLRATAIATGSATLLGNRVVTNIRVTDTSSMAVVAAATASMARSPEIEPLLGEPVRGEIPRSKADAAPASALHVVTNAEYREFVTAGGYDHADHWDADGWAWRMRADIHGPAYKSSPSLNLPSQPVVGVSWYEARAYASWRSDVALPESAPSRDACSGGVASVATEISLWIARPNSRYPQTKDIVRDCQPAGYLPPETRRADLGFGTVPAPLAKENR